MVTKEEIKAVLANTLSMSTDDLEDSMLLEGGDIQSLQYVEILVVIEAKYGIRASNDELDEIKNIYDLTEFIFNKINVNNP